MNESHHLFEAELKCHGYRIAHGRLYAREQAAENREDKFADAYATRRRHAQKPAHPLHLAQALDRAAAAMDLQERVNPRPFRGPQMAFALLDGAVGHYRAIMRSSGKVKFNPSYEHIMAWVRNSQ